MDRKLIATTLLIIVIPYNSRAIQFAPLVTVQDITDCAFVLTNVAEYSANLLDSEINEPVHCITYDDINRAYMKTKKRTKIEEIRNEMKTEYIAAIGELLLDVSIQIANLYDLSPEDIEIALPQVDTSKTLIKDICPAFLSTVNCKAGRYRRFDGVCNNIKNPSWGATMTPFTRLLPPQFSDHISQPRRSVTGNNLPSARIVSRTVHPDEGYHDHASTVMLVAWGQFMDHDFTLMGTPLDSKNRNEPEECCRRPDHLKNPYCFEISIPEDDYFYQKYRVKCQDFVRAYPAVQPGCKLGPRNPFNTLTAVIDGNTIYGVSEDFARYLRSGVGGQLRMNPVFSQFGLKDLLPMKTDIPDEGCIRSNASQYCFLAGEIRVNEQLVLTCIHTLMAREHNRIAAELSHINPHWDDELLYQETRRIVIAEIQHITYNEFLPLLLGKDVMKKYGLLLETQGYWDGYDQEVNPNIMDAFSSAAFRFGHSLLPSANERWSKAHRFIASKRLSELIRKPYDLYRAGVLDEYFVGLANQVAQAMDDSITQEVTNHLIQKPGNYFGLDLVSFNIQRGRDFGLPGYMHFRKHCGLETVDDFIDMVGFVSNSTVQRYMSIYEHPNDIDLWSGGVSEKPLPGSMLGPTFACIIATQMNLIRRGDRFWYELPNQPSSFTAEQLQEIRKVKLSRILCDNTDLIDTIQVYPMVLPDHEINRRVSCKSSVLPEINLQHWADTPSASLFDTKHALVTTTVSGDGLNCPECVLARKAATSSGHEYRRAKTSAIIDDGISPALHAADLLKPFDFSSSSYYYDRSIPTEFSVRKISKRSLSSKFKFNDTNLSSSRNTTKDEPVRKERYPHDMDPHTAANNNNNQMTRAIMKGVNEESFDMSETSYDRPPEKNNKRKYEQSENYDVEKIFRKNVPIYDGFLPKQTGIGYSSSYVNPKIKNGYYFENDREDDDKQTEDALEGEEQEEEKQEDEDDDTVDGLIDVHDDHDAQYEYVPMDITEDGKQISKKEPFSIDDEEEQQQQEIDDKSEYRQTEDEESPQRPNVENSVKYPLPNYFDKGRVFEGSNNYGSSSTAGNYDFGGKFSNDHPNAIAGYPSFGDNFNFNKFRSVPRPHSDFFPYPSNYGASSSIKYPDANNFKYPDLDEINPPSFRQQNDERNPIIGTSHQFNSLGDSQPRYYNHYHDSRRPAGNYYGAESTFSETDFNPKPRLPISDYVPKRGNYVTPPYNGRSPHRTTHVPNTLEEYHRLHNNAKQDDDHPPPSANAPYYRDDVNQDGKRGEEYEPDRHSLRQESNLDDDHRSEEAENENSRKRTFHRLSNDGEPPKSFMTLTFGPEATEDYASADADDVTIRKKTVGDVKRKSNISKSNPNREYRIESIKSKSPARSSISVKRPQDLSSSKRYRQYMDDAPTKVYRRKINDRRTRSRINTDTDADSDDTNLNIKLIESVNNDFGKKIVKRSSDSQDQEENTDNEREESSSRIEQEINDDDEWKKVSDNKTPIKESSADALVEESSLKSRRNDQNEDNSNNNNNNSEEDKHFSEENYSESYVM